jgi:acyl dehydratase
VKLATIDEAAPLAGTSLGSTGWRLLDQETVTGFGRLTGDEQWIHVDPERAAAGAFGGTVAHGLLTLSLLPGMVDELFTVDGVDLVLNKGFGRVRFLAPVPVGARVRGVVRLVSAEPRAQGFWELVFHVDVQVDDRTALALSADLILLYR